VGVCAHERVVARGLVLPLTRLFFVSPLSFSCLSLPVLLSHPRPVLFSLHSFSLPSLFHVQEVGDRDRGDVTESMFV